MASSLPSAPERAPSTLARSSGEALAADALGAASDVMMEHPLALQLRNLQTLIEIAVDKNSTVIFPAPLMSTISELGSFIEHETSAAQRKRAQLGFFEDELES